MTIHLATLRRWAALSAILVISTAGHAGNGGTALDKTTLTYSWSNIVCGVTLPGGATTYHDCATPSFSAMLDAGQTVFVTATLNYTYSDDGLPLDRPTAIGPGTFVPIDHEAGVIFLNGRCDSRACLGAYTTSYDGPSRLIFGNNTTPDQLSGQFTYTSSVTALATNTIPINGSAFLMVAQVDTYSGVAPIPEPSTYALLLAGLAGMGLFVRRR